MNRNSWVVWLAAVAMVVGTARARGDDAIGPFVDSQTNGVIYVDFSAIDMDQLDAWLQKVETTIADPAQRAQQQKDIEDGLGKSKKWISDFKAAGGKDLYVVISLSGIMSGAPGGVVVPLNGGDGSALAKVFPQAQAPPAGLPDASAAQWARMQPASAVVGGEMVFSTGAGVDRMKTPSSEVRQDLADALAAGKGGAVEIAFNPAMLKNNPFFAMMLARNGAGGPGQSPLSDPVWDGVTWVSVSLTAPPKEMGNMTIQCKDADSAAAMSGWIAQKMQDGKADATKGGSISADDYDKLISVVKPVVKGSQVVVSVDQDAIDNVIGPIFMKSAVNTMQPGAVNGNLPATAPAPAENGM